MSSVKWTKMYTEGWIQAASYNGVLWPLCFIQSLGLFQFDYPNLTTSGPQHRSARYPVYVPFLLTAFSICMDVTASACTAKQIGELWSISFYRGLRDSSEKTPLLVTRPWWYHHRKFSSKQVVQRCIYVPVVTAEHNLVAGGKNRFIFSF